MCPAGPSGQRGEATASARNHNPVGVWSGAEGVPSLRSKRPETAFRISHRGLSSPLLRFTDFVSCPLDTSLSGLGRKWTLAIIRDIGLYGVDRFSRLRKSIPDIPPKVLATRLKELEAQGIVRKSVEKARPPKIVRWSLTEKGLDALRVEMAVAAYGSRWYAHDVFEDGRPRSMREIYNHRGIQLFTKIL